MWASASIESTAPPFGGLGPRPLTWDDQSMTTTTTITGTGTPVPSPDRAGPGVLVEVDGLALQFDAGRNTLARLAAAGVSPRDLDAVFVTHYHCDHLVGLQDLVLTRWIMDRTNDAGPLRIVAPTGATADHCRNLLTLWEADLEVRSQHNHRSHDSLSVLDDFAVPTAPTVVWESDDVRVLAGPVRHEPVVGAVGFRIETADGVVAISGDTLVCDEVAELAVGADVLVYEALRFEPIESRPPHLHFILDYHADSRLIGAQAAELGVATLVLTHLIPAPTNDAERQEYIDDIRQGGFDGVLIVADDLDSVVLG